MFIFAHYGLQQECRWKANSKRLQRFTFPYFVCFVFYYYIIIIYCFCHVETKEDPKTNLMKCRTGFY